MKTAVVQYKQQQGTDTFIPFGKDDRIDDFYSNVIDGASFQSQ